MCLFSFLINPVLQSIIWTFATTIKYYNVYAVYVFSDLSLSVTLPPQAVCLGIQPSYQVVGCHCYWLHYLLVGAELQDVGRNISLPVQQNASSDGETGHNVPQLCTKEEIAIALWKPATGSEYGTVGHPFGVSTVWLWVQEFCAAAES